MLKHVGKHNDRKVVVLYRTVPNEDHMCLVTYSDVLPRLVHDEIMQVLESAVGQQAVEFSDALFRHTMADGRNALQALHSEGYIKKVPTNQVVVTPTSTASVRLDELNAILSKMKDGEEAVKKMAELDKNSGLKDTRKDQPVTSMQAGTTEVLTDEQIAANLQSQAEQMMQQAEGLIAEAKRLKEEAKQLAPTQSRNVNKKSKATTTA